MTKKLSKREKQVLKMLLAEYSQIEISETLNLSYSRVNSVKQIIMEKWEVETMIGLVKEGIKQGYLELEEDTFDTTSHTPMVGNQSTFIYTYTKQ